jgi:hypothetical protein
MNRVGRPLSFLSRSNSVSVKTESQAMAEWGYEASLLVKRGMRDRGWGYSELAEALKTQGIKRSVEVINRRINRGNFSAGFLLACLYVLENGADVQTSREPTGGVGKTPTYTTK